MRKRVLRGLTLCLAVLFLLGMKTEVFADARDMGVAEFDTAYSGTTEDDAPAHVYSFEIEKSGRVAFNYTFSVVDWNRFELHDAAGNEILFERVGAGTFNNTVNLLAGEYVISIHAYVGSGLEYSFSMAYEPSGETNSESYLARNDEVGTASDYTVGDKVKAQFAANDETDIYKTKVNSNCFVTIDMNSDMSDMRGQLYSSMGDVKYDINGISVGKHSYSYFCPKGTYYLVLSRGSNGGGIYDIKLSTSAIPKTKVKSAKNVSDGTICVKWKRSEVVSGYQVQYSTDKKFKKNSNTVDIVGMSEELGYVSYLKKGSTYYVRVRTFVYDSNRKQYFSKWSPAKSVKVTK